jgi:uncharacterized protein (DUF2141 family)
MRLNLSNYRIAIMAAIFAVVLSIGGTQSAGQTSSALTVSVTGARNDKGKIGVTLFKSADGFPSDISKAVFRQSVDIDPHSLGAKVVFKDVPIGTYAVAVLHDENGNGKMDKNLLGVPKEGYGASNNPPKKMRPPTFDEAKFSLDASEKTVEIRLIY